LILNVSWFPPIFQPVKSFPLKREIHPFCANAIGAAARAKIRVKRVVIPIAFDLIIAQLAGWLIQPCARIEQMAAKSTREQTLKDAWIGDAVLSLYARSRILREDGIADSGKAERMTSNRFLSVVADPSEAEAAIGRIYEREGLAAAFRWIEERLMPVFDRQEANRLRREGVHHRKSCE
jgi:hypothetical protein